MIILAVIIVVAAVLPLVALGLLGALLLGVGRIVRRAVAPLLARHAEQLVERAEQLTGRGEQLTGRGEQLTRREDQLAGAAAVGQAG